MRFYQDLLLYVFLILYITCMVLANLSTHALVLSAMKQPPNITSLPKHWFSFRKWHFCRDFWGRLFFFGSVTFRKVLSGVSWKCVFKNMHKIPPRIPSVGNSNRKCLMARDCKWAMQLLWQDIWTLPLDRRAVLGAWKFNT